jgi:hypothetical protein
LVHPKNSVLKDQTTNIIGDNHCAKETAIIGALVAIATRNSNMWVSGVEN